MTENKLSLDQIIENALLHKNPNPENVTETPKPKRKTKSRAVTKSNSTIELHYTLDELPSSQHRAGLAGLVLTIQWIKEKENFKGICDITKLNSKELTIRIDFDGLSFLFDAVYKASVEETESKTLWKNKEPLRIETKEIINKGKTKNKTIYIYNKTIPDGAFLNDWDETGLWIKLWRDMIWNILRGLPAQRLPYDFRAEGKIYKDFADTWSDLQKNNLVDLQSTCFLGAQEHTAENNSFYNSAKLKFLLNFWPFIAQIYVPRIINNEGEMKYDGYVVAVPDVANLENFCEDFKNIIRCRLSEDNIPVGSRPRGSLIDFNIESGLDFLIRIKTQIQLREGNKSTTDLIYGIDIFHMEKDGNSVRIRNVCRIDPDDSIINEYARFRGIFWNALFRKQYIANFVNKKEWYHGFDILIATLPFNFFIRPKDKVKYKNHDYVASQFSRDSRVAFETRANMVETDKEAKPNSLETIIYRVVGTYISAKISKKHNLKYEKDMNNEDLLKYRGHKEDIARDAFYAIRSRTGVNFVKYFTETICSVPQHINETDYTVLSQALLNSCEYDTIRTLTLLALSARS